MMNQKPKVTIEHDEGQGWVEMSIDNLVVYRGPEMMRVADLEEILSHMAIVTVKDVVYV